MNQTAYIAFWISRIMLFFFQKISDLSSPNSKPYPNYTASIANRSKSEFLGLALNNFWFVHKLPFLPVPLSSSHPFESTLFPFRRKTGERLHQRVPCVLYLLAGRAMAEGPREAGGWGLGIYSLVLSSQSIQLYRLIPPKFG